MIDGLLKAGPDGLALKELKKIKTDAAKYLGQLRDESDAWNAAIVMAGQAYRRYSIRHA